MRRPRHNSTANLNQFIHLTPFFSPNTTLRLFIFGNCHKCDLLGYTGQDKALKHPPLPCLHIRRAEKLFNSQQSVENLADHE